MMLSGLVLLAVACLDLGVVARPAAHDVSPLDARTHHRVHVTGHSLVRRAKRCGPKSAKPTSSTSSTATKAQNVADKPAKTSTTKSAEGSTSSASRTSTSSPKPKPTQTENKTKTETVIETDNKPEPTTTKSSAAAPKPTANAFSGFKALFPAAANSASSSSRSWSTASGAPNHIDLSTSALRATSIMSLAHPVAEAPDGKEAFEISFKKGAYDFQGPAGGFSFFIRGPDDVDLTTAREATFAYRVFFQDGFAYNLGGKMPGLVGGESDSVSQGCNGGHKATNCFSARMMWRSDAKGELYAYLPPGLPGNSAVCDKVGPESHCNPTYGSSLGRGAFHFKSGGWTTVAQRVLLNDVGENNGEIEIFINGESVIKATGITLRKADSGRIRMAHVQSFFGGHTPEWASPKDQKMWYSDFSLAITKTL